MARSMGNGTPRPPPAPRRTSPEWKSKTRGQRPKKAFGHSLKSCAKARNAAARHCTANAARAVAGSSPTPPRALPGPRRCAVTASAPLPLPLPLASISERSVSDGSAAARIGVPRLGGWLLPFSACRLWTMYGAPVTAQGCRFASSASAEGSSGSWTSWNNTGNACNNVCASRSTPRVAARPYRKCSLTHFVAANTPSDTSRAALRTAAGLRSTRRAKQERARLLELRSLSRRNSAAKWRSRASSCPPCRLASCKACAINRNTTGGAPPTRLSPMPAAVAAVPALASAAGSSTREQSARTPGETSGGSASRSREPELRSAPAPRPSQISCARATWPSRCGGAMRSAPRRAAQRSSKAPARKLPATPPPPCQRSTS
mmetsp:Transcript_41662/g.116048  ORF Transcript_41662/g.116048 Transcript_41662/m.116048 type:complete len:375 (-) Transcript_41662:54-1178(-)